MILKLNELRVLVAFAQFAGMSEKIIATLSILSTKTHFLERNDIASTLS